MRLEAMWEEAPESITQYEEFGSEVKATVLKALVDSGVHGDNADRGA